MWFEYCGVIIVVEDQCLWLSWVSLVHEFTPPWTYIYKHLCNIHLRSRTCYQRNYDPTNQEMFDYPRTLTPSNKSDSTVNTFSKSTQGRIPTPGFLACRKKRLCDVMLIVLIVYGTDKPFVSTQGTNDALFKQNICRYYVNFKGWKFLVILMDLNRKANVSLLYDKSSEGAMILELNHDTLFFPFTATILIHTSPILLEWMSFKEERFTANGSDSRNILTDWR